MPEWHIWWVKPPKTVIPWEMKKWPSYRDGRLERFYCNCISSRAFRPTRGIVIQKFVCASVRASVRMMSQTCNRQNLRTVIGMDLLFFLMGRYKQGVVQWPKKSWKGCEKKVWNCKKGVKYEKKKILKID